MNSKSLWLLAILIEKCIKISRIYLREIEGITRHRRHTDRDFYHLGANHLHIAHKNQEGQSRHKLVLSIVSLYPFDSKLLFSSLIELAEISTFHFLFFRTF